MPQKSRASIHWAFFKFKKQDELKDKRNINNNVLRRAIKRGRKNYRIGLKNSGQALLGSIPRSILGLQTSCPRKKDIILITRRHSPDFILDARFRISDRSQEIFDRIRQSFTFGVSPLFLRRKFLRRLKKSSRGLKSFEFGPVIPGGIRAGNSKTTKSSQDVKLSGWDLKG